MSHDLLTSIEMLTDAYKEIQFQLSKLDPQYLTACIDVDGEIEKQHELMKPLLDKTLNLKNDAAKRFSKRINLMGKTDCSEQVNETKYSYVSDALSDLYREAIIVKNMCYAIKGLS